ncbi:hypothetical protein L3X38_036155 [Prunus dulcis]|uniref:Uncharacterized protein n=1 Tax=Prunus dulcis TaxID=3755 RepID=A0AAD4YQ29_PRUDU|nr:hypothetical protein L3X38_036155 [Prunus dulcis]
MHQTIQEVADLYKRKEVLLHLRWPENSIIGGGVAPLLQTNDAHHMFDEMCKPVYTALLLVVMERYFQRKSLNPPSNNPSSFNPPSNNPASSNPPSNNPASSNHPSKNPPTSHPPLNNSSSNPPSNNPASSNHPSKNPPTSHPPLNNSSSPKRSKVTELDEILANLPADPGLRHPMTYYNPNFREQI